MSGPFAITAATSSVRLDASRRAGTAFTVSNVSGIPIRGRARLVPQNPATQGWLTLLGDAERNFSTTGTEQYTVQVVVPADAASGKYVFRLDVVGVVNPDEMFTEGPTVTFEVGGAKPQKKPFPWWILLVLAGMLAIIACIVTIVLWPRGETVPLVTGMTVREATDALVEAGFSVGELTSAFSDDVPQGEVIRSDPAGGEKDKKGTAVSLVISDGPAPPGAVAVPGVAGATIEEAGARIVAAGLVLGGSTGEFSDDVGAGRVIRSDPAESAQVEQGSTVALVVSDGPAPPEAVQVPSLVGLTPAEAGAELNRSGLVVGGSTEEFSNEVAQGQVIRSDPAAGTEVEQGAVVALYVSKGPADPDLFVTGLALDPSVPVQEQQVVAKVGVRNGGEGSASAFTVEWWAGENFPEAACTWNVSGLAAGEEWTQSCIYDGYSSWYGQLTTKVIADTTGAVTEQDEANNEFTMVIRVDKPAEPAVHSQGDLDVPQTWTVDLDEGLVGAGGDTDFQFQAVTAAERYLTPRNGAAIAWVGGSDVGWTECQGASLSSDRINMNDLPVGAFICVRTNLGRYAKLRLISIEYSDDGAVMTLSIAYLTWE